MLTREKKITESLIIKEEPLLFLIKVSHIPLLYFNMVLLIHSERPMELSESSQASQNGLMILQSLDHLESVTYRNMATINLSVQIQTISKIQLKIL